MFVHKELESRPTHVLLTSFLTSLLNVPGDTGTFFADISSLRNPQGICNMLIFSSTVLCSKSSDVQELEAVTRTITVYYDSG